MVVLLIFAFLSGIVTILAPCIWPLLPIILSSTATGGNRKPLGITLGIMVSFTFFTLSISYIVKIIPFDPNVLRLLAVLIMVFFGATLLIPQLNQWVEGAVSRLSSRFTPQKNGSGFISGFITGISLGIVWSPCAGPILATIATLAATQAVNAAVVLVTVVYVTGIGIPLFFFALLGSSLFKKSSFVNKYTGSIQKLFGFIMILTALAILTNFDKVIQAKLLNAVPSYSTFLLQLESNTTVQNQLRALKGNNTKQVPMPFPVASSLPDFGPAPEFAGITKWLNTNSPVTLAQLKGKVVLVDFWTYTCINCIRTLPYVTSWFEKYKDQGFVVVGVHTPEFEFEKKTANVQDAMKRYSIHYPVAQDNDYETWQAYNNQYWPAEYLIDANGHIRHTSFGEGEYDKTEKAIQTLLQEAGKQASTQLSNIADQTPRDRISPETYFGSARAEYYYPNRTLSEGTQQFSLHTPLPANSFSLGGTWDIQKESAVSGTDAQLIYSFHAHHVYAVLRPGNDTAEIKVYLDGKPIAKKNSGQDVVNGVLTLQEQRLYDIVQMDNMDDHELRLEFVSPGIELYTFTFG